MWRIDKEKIKKWVKQDGIVEEAIYGIDDDWVRAGIDRAIELAIDFTLKEVEQENEHKDTDDEKPTFAIPRKRKELDTVRITRKEASK